MTDAATRPADAATTAPVLDVRGLSVRFRMRGERYVRAVTDAHFTLEAGQRLALVGESGCGKSVLASALLGLLPENAETAGSALLGDGTDLLAADERTLARTVRGRKVGLVPQSPAAHLTPVRTIRSQLEETVRELLRTPRAAVRKAAEEAAGRASFPADHLDRYPHELSGGLAQRAATALALIGDAPLLLADEPTTGLDRDLVEHTVDELARHTGSSRALLMITHDLAAAERIADRIAVMYAGRIVEICDAEDFFGARGPRHPYARGLLNALPEREFAAIPGMPPELGALPEGCAFAARCGRASEACRVQPPFADLLACHHPVSDRPAADPADPAEALEAEHA
ncbi:ABC transporter ATP-binding protein [Streptomyces indicus]|uniref:Nickel import system ATP-binding protein NikD n=1 Tax=Streptomyces indicus TaxID=417292 RepID=A0A1G8TS33_9ACTN|nr:ABC transporter ATP-binding protein [Streptomyces indicus]SDJ43735.1 peptide/nickel transport system ATP-binding protein [Streptomyces indicus]